MSNALKPPFVVVNKIERKQCAEVGLILNMVSL